MAPEIKSALTIPSQAAGIELDGFFSHWYDELHRQASSALRRDRRATLNPAALVSEAFLKLKDSPDFSSKTPEHCIGIAACAMRQVLVDEARRRKALKRGGAGDIRFTTLGDFPEQKIFSAEEILALNTALEKLARMNPRQAQMVDLRFFAGQNMAEVATMLGVAKSTVERDWSVVRAWLAKELRGERK